MVRIVSRTSDLMTLAARAIQDSDAPADPDYPRIHVAPPIGRLNDPNGLVHFDGRYHAFYQFAPFFPHQRLIFWGHASTTDLLHWETHPPALAPDAPYDRTGVYSGGAIVEDDRVWLHYTGNVKHPDGERESSQCAATSTDLSTFPKDAANPLIPGPPPGYTAHFRDPQVRRDPDGGYRMILGAQRANETGCVLVYHSPDLLSWELLGELEFPGAENRFAKLGFMWECPNLLRIADEVSGEVRDVLVFCPQGIEFQDGLEHNEFPCCYVVGRLEGRRFLDASEVIELDNGFEFYAPQGFCLPDHPAGTELLLGWLGNPGQDDQPSLREHGWVHALTVPRWLSLRNGRLIQRPAISADGQRLAEPNILLADDELEFTDLAAQRAFLLRLRLDPNRDAEWKLSLGPTGSEVHLSGVDGVLTIDRSATRYSVGGQRRTVLVPGGIVDLEVIQDGSITEVFVNAGAASFTMRVFFADGERRVRLATSGELRILEAEGTLF